MERFPALRLILKLGRIGAAIFAVSLTALFIVLTYGVLGIWLVLFAPTVFAVGYFLFKSYVEIIQIITEMVH